MTYISGYHKYSHGITWRVNLHLRLGELMKLVFLSEQKLKNH